MILALILITLGVLALVALAVVLLTRRRREVQTLEPTHELPVDTGDTDLLVPDTAAPDLAEVPVVAEPPSVVAEPEVLAPEKPSFRERLSKARGAVSGYFGAVLSRGKVDAETWEELEEALISADVGVPTTMAMLERVRTQVKEQSITDAGEMMAILKAEMIAEASGYDITLSTEGSPAIWMFVGVNGVGKTTTIGKLAHREVAAGRKLVLGAGDTFRAAAAEQLETWAQRAGAGYVRGAEGADPGSVIFDAVEHAAADGADLVLADTAGRLHNKANLMEELRKVRRVAEKGEGTVSEVLLVIDATTGQNGLVQAKQFTEAVDVTGVVLTKLDGSAKGGIVLAIQSELGIPVKLVGLGEGIADLVEFDPNEFVDALFSS